MSNQDFYIKNGYAVIDTHLADKLIQLKKDWLATFNNVSLVNGGPKILRDRDIVSLYSSHKDLWIAGYDQARQLTRLYSLVDDECMSKICEVAGIKFPAYTCQISTRMDMPFGKGSQPAQAHQDYPTHQGSANSITVWIPLHDVNVNNGTIEVVPRSHLNGYIEKDSSAGINDFVSPGSLRKLDKYDLSKVSGFVPVDLRIGQVLVFSQFLLHQSGLNSTSDTIRFSVQFRLNDLLNNGYAKRKYYINVQHVYKKEKPGFSIGFND
jgi:hypothetical protein